MEEKTYVLMREPVKEGDYTAQIHIVDNSTAIGKSKVQRMINDGCTCVGKIISSERISFLRSGFYYEKQEQLDKCRAMFDEIAAICQSFYNIK